MNEPIDADVEKFFDFFLAVEHRSSSTSKIQSRNFIAHSVALTFGPSERLLPGKATVGANDKILGAMASDRFSAELAGSSRSVRLLI